MHSKAIFSSNLRINIKRAIDLKKPSKVILVTDTNTYIHCAPLLYSISFDLEYSLPTGEIHKNLTSLDNFLSFLVSKKADKNTLLIALGGGMVTDLVGFAASIYKRGISYINVPTTLLSMVDASIGGKTGIDFKGIKNAIGSMYPPLCVLSDKIFLETLPSAELKSGWAEVLKHLLIANQRLPEIIPSITNKDLNDWSSIKYEIIRKDPYENNLRLALNAGHTVGHAIESFYLDNHKPISHGNAVAVGLWIEAYIYKEKFKDDWSFQQLNRPINMVFPKLIFNPKDICPMLELMTNDKKNRNNAIMCSFIGSKGNLNVEVATEPEITNAIHAYIKN